MTIDPAEIAALQRRDQLHHDIENTITRMFAPEDDGLRSALAAGKAAGLPQIQISPIEGRFLQLLAKACGARKILEIGSLAGYSGIWLARALPPTGQLIALELDAKHAEVIRDSFAHAGVAERCEVRVGRALDLLPQLTSEAPFDLIFIDADKPAYPAYLDWALRLSRPGSIIVADNCIRGGAALSGISEDEGTKALARYNQLTIDNPRLTALALAIDNDYTDGFNIAVVQPEEE